MKILAFLRLINFLLLFIFDPRTIFIRATNSETWQLENTHRIVNFETVSKSADNFRVSIVSPTNLSPIRNFDSADQSFNIDETPIYIRIEAPSVPRFIDFIRLEISGDLPQAPTEFSVSVLDEDGIITIPWDLSPYIQTNTAYSVKITVTLVDELGNVSLDSQQAIVRVLDGSPLLRNTSSGTEFASFTHKVYAIVSFLIGVIFVLVIIWFKENDILYSISTWISSMPHRTNITSDSISFSDNQTAVDAIPKDKSLAELWVNKGRTITVSKIKVTETEFTLGRDSDIADFVVNEESVSRVHCTIYSRGNKFEIIDLSSDNGTYINGEKIPAEVRTNLQVGDQIDLGSEVQFKFMY